ncbi:MAG: bifunctional lysine-specific demethylase and histidyl-hydroxylase [Frankiaceae bacterium]|nr:bifunctional lysine-specific demethylase and histidyl-hydroxylase [Frankiaceae bacterium]
MNQPAAAGAGRTPGVVGSADVRRGAAVLARLVGDVEAFLRDHWARAPLLRSVDDPGLVRGLLTIADVDTLLAQRSPRLPMVRVVRDGSAVPAVRFTTTARIGSTQVGDLIDPGLIAAEFAAGSTISLQGLQRYWQPLTEFCQSLEAVLTHPFQANAYLSPPAATGLSVHHDTHDVFVLQVEGSKHFDVYEPVTWLPVSGQHWTSKDPPADPVISVDLKPGDCLYMPRGWRHRAFTTDSHSLHLTIGLLGYTWLGLESVLAADLRQQPAFREPLPAGFANDPDALTAAVAERLTALRSWLDGADPAAIAESLTRRFVRARPAPPAGIAAAVTAVTIAADTPVRRTPFARCLLRQSPHGVDLVLADRVVTFPLLAATVVRAVVTRESFTAADLPGALDLPGRLVVVRRLVAEGLLVAG